MFCYDATDGKLLWQRAVESVPGSPAQQPEIPVLWVDHGYNRPATYRHAEELSTLLRLNLKSLVA